MKIQIRGVIILPSGNEKDFFMKTDYEKIYEHSFALYKELHQFPEIGFDLDKTVKIVKNELTALEISFTEKYGKGSVVAEIGKGKRCIALRADMDALPIKGIVD